MLRLTNWATAPEGDLAEGLDQLVVALDVLVEEVDAGAAGAVVGLVGGFEFGIESDVRWCAQIEFADDFLLDVGAVLEAGIEVRPHGGGETLGGEVGGVVVGEDTVVVGDAEVEGVGRGGVGREELDGIDMVRVEKEAGAEGEWIAESAPVCLRRMGALGRGREEPHEDGGSLSADKPGLLNGGPGCSEHGEDHRGGDERSCGEAEGGTMLEEHGGEQERGEEGEVDVNEADANEAFEVHDGGEQGEGGEEGDPVGGVGFGDGRSRG